MEKTCEFCGALQPVVHCQADAALLCLSCDSKVHSANALFSRHSRTILCDSCKGNPAYVRCLDHSMLICQQCDSQFHKAFSSHKKLRISSFTGCPSAKHFATLWGIDVNEFDHMSTVETSSTSIISREPNIGSRNEHLKKLNDHQQKHYNSIIMNQILDLKNLQLIDGDNSTKPLCYKGEYYTSSLDKFDEKFENEYNERELNCCTNELEILENPNQNDLSCSSSVGDPFWQYKSPVHNNQFWLQNLQDPGMCQELGCSDDFNIPDVDVTFRNFEDLLTGDPDLTRALLEDDDPMLENLKKASFDNFEKTLLEATQASLTVSSSIATNKHVNCLKEINPLDRSNHGLSDHVLNPPRLIRFSQSTTYSGSQLSAESNDSYFRDSGNSRNIRRDVLSNKLKDGEFQISVSKEKKKPRLQGKRTQLAPRKAKADMNKRIKSQCAKLQGYESDPANVTISQ